MKIDMEVAPLEGSSVEDIRSIVDRVELDIVHEVSEKEELSKRSSLKGDTI